MLKYILIVTVMGIGVLNANNIQNIEQLKAEKEVLELRLEAYTLKRKLIEMENFFEKSKVEKKERLEREKALIRLKHELRTSRKHRNSHYEG